MNDTLITTISGSSGIDWIQVLIQSSIITILVTLCTSIILAKLNSEYDIRRSFYENNINIIFEYYTIFYQYYRLCQKTATVDIIRDRHGKEISTRDLLINGIVKFVDSILEIESKIQLILPDNILSLHEESIKQFNAFRNVMKSYNLEHEKPKDDLKAKFELIDKQKDLIRNSLKEYLRSEKVLKKWFAA